MLYGVDKHMAMILIEFDVTKHLLEEVTIDGVILPSYKNLNTLCPDPTCSTGLGI